jgi:membrane-bound serine protease (ClpP class)
MRISPVPAVLVAALSWAALALPCPAEESVFVVPVQGEIDVGRADLVKRAARTAVAAGARALVLEIDTPGGAVLYMEQICRSLDRARDAGCEIVAFVNGNAWSAGAIICAASDKIFMKRISSLGAAQPIYFDGKGIREGSEKIVSAMRAEARAYAQKTGRPAALVEAMVDPDLEVLEVRTPEGRKFLSRAKYDDELARAYREGFDLTTVGTVVEKGKLLSLSATEAEEYGFIQGVVGNLSEALDAAGLGNAEVRHLRLNWAQGLANFLSSPGVSTILFILGVIGIYVEFKTPGFGLPGIGGIILLGLFFFGKYAVGLAEVYEILIFAAGVLLIFLEIFVIPGFGLPGILGILFVIAGLFLASQDFIVPENKGDFSALKENLFFTTLSLAGTIGCALALGYVLPKTPFLRRMVLAAPGAGTAAGGPAAAERDSLVGKVGVSVTVLRPSGKGRIGEKLIDVVTEGDFVDEGAWVRVVKVEGNRVVVRPAEEEETPS